MRLYIFGFQNIQIEYQLAQFAVPDHSIPYIKMQFELFKFY